MIDANVDSIEALPAAEAAGPAAAAAPERVKLLVVDDRAENLQAVEAVLGSPDHEIIPARSGPEALRFLLHDDCALILMDVQMPHMDGFETARLIRSNQRTRSIPIVFMTAVSQDPRLVARGYGTGAVDYLVKPVDPDVLRAKVAAFTELHRAKQEVLRQAALLREHEQRERRRAIAEMELKHLRRERAAQERYRRLLDGISRAFVWTLEPASLACSFVSTSAEEILGRPLDAWTSGPRAWLTVFPEDERAGLLRTLRGLASGGPPVALEHRLVRADGRVGTFQTDVRVVPSEEDGASELRAFSIEVTEQREAEQAIEFLDRAGTALAGSIDLQETLAVAAWAPVPFLADCCIVAAGDEGEARLVGVAPRGGPEEPVLRAVADDAAALRAPAGGKASIVQDLRERLGAAASSGAIGAASAVTIALEARGQPLGTMLLLGAPGRVWRARELRLVEELGRRAAQAIDHGILYRRARAAVEARDEFISIASHELRTPLTPLLLQIKALERILAPTPDGPERANVLQRLANCSRQVNRMTRLVSNLLDLTRIRAGRLDLAREPLDLSELAGDIAARTREELARGGRAVELEAGEPVVGAWDRVRLDQVIANLVSNAARYGGSGPVRVAVRREGEDAVVSVADEGTGIAPEDVARLFDRYGTGANARGRGGLGLGLYVTRQIVEAHGGRIDVDSTLGRGSTFTVRLPIASPGGDPAGGAPAR